MESQSDPWPWGERRPRQKRLAGGDAVDPVPIEGDRRRGLVAELDLERVTALEAERADLGTGERPDRGGRLSWTQVQGAGLGLQRQHRRPVGDRPAKAAPEPTRQRLLARRINSRRSSLGRPLVIEMCFAMADADHFPLDMSSRPALLGSWPAKRPFFCCELMGPCYKPPPAASRPDMMLSAGVAELVDALDLGSSDESCGGSSPSARTKRFQRLHDE